METEQGAVTREIWRAVPTRPPRRSGLCFVRGEKLEDLERDLEMAQHGLAHLSSSLLARFHWLESTDVPSEHLAAPGHQ